jgi:hypothetical protein
LLLSAFKSIYPIAETLPGKYALGQTTLLSPHSASAIFEDAKVQKESITAKSTPPYFEPSGKSITAASQPFPRNILTVTNHFE